MVVLEAMMLDLHIRNLVNDGKSICNNWLKMDEYPDNERKKTGDVEEMMEKENLRLEAENFELRLELERANLNLPRYQEKIQHLEK
jgi:hypothetical protein